MHVEEGNTELFIAKLMEKRKRSKLGDYEGAYLKAVERRARKND